MDYWLQIILSLSAMKLEKSFDRQLKVKQILFSAITFVVFITLGSFGISGQTAPTLPEAKNENYRIGPGDVIDVIVSKQTILSRAGIRVSNEGMIQLPMLDQDIPALCMTEKELATLITEKYKKYLVNPNVIVAVTQFNSTPVALIGSVLSPIRFQLQRPMRLMEALLLSNGPNAQAGSVIQIVRINTNNCYQNVTPTDTPKEELLSFNLKDTLEGKEEANPFVLPGDVIRVVEADVVKIGQAFIIGNVNTAKTIDLKDPVTLTQAIAMAGGTTPDAQIDKILISRRKTDSLDKTELVVSLKEIKKRKEEDIFLQANDIIEVPGPSGTKKFLKDLIRTVIPGITRFPMPVRVP